MNLFKSAIVFLSLVCGSVYAATPYTTYEYYDETNRATDIINYKFAAVGGVKATAGMDYSLKMEFSQQELGKGSISQGLEIRIRKTFGSDALKPWAGIRIGESIKSTTAFSYYAVDYGVKFPIYGKLSGDVGGRYRNAFSADNFETNRAFALVQYALTKQNSVSLRFTRSYGDEEKDSFRYSFTHNF